MSTNGFWKSVLSIDLFLRSHKLTVETKARIKITHAESLEPLLPHFFRALPLLSRRLATRQTAL